MGKKGWLTNQEQIKIAKFKGKNPSVPYSEIAKKFDVTIRQVFNAVHKYPDISKVEKKDFTDPQLLKEIAIYKALHPKTTYAFLEKKFSVPTYVVRYAIQKYAEYSVQAELMKATKKGRIIKSQYEAEDIDQITILKKQLNYCLAHLENDNKLALASRVDLLYKAMRIRLHIQQVELESHLKRADALLIANIIRRFRPQATDDEIIKIYNEEIEKIKIESDSRL